MILSPPVPALSLTSINVSEIETDLLIIPVFEADALDDVPGLEAASGGHVRRAMDAREIQGRPYEYFVTPLSGWKAPRVALVGAGKRAEFDTERLRRVATAAALGARVRRVVRIAWLIRGDIPPSAAVQASVEGLGLAAFSIDRYKSAEKSGPPPEMIVVALPGGTAPELTSALERGRILAEACNMTRELCNEPSNVLTPRELADRALKIARDTHLDVEVLDEHGLQRLEMGLLLGVGRGSLEPPRVIVLTHTPRGAAGGEAPVGAPVLGLVGKGITFDTGGISIKPAEGMERMKSDMSGGAAVIGAMRAISLLNAPVKVIGIIPAAENMPGGRAIKPGDILTGAGGKTVEVINTDAEGRLVLGDGLWYAKERGATHLVDVATLTGACVVALGKVASGLFGQPDEWVDVVKGAAKVAGDRCWPMPLFDEYAEQLKSEIADLTNSGGRPAGACTAAMFLKEFAGGLPWAHFDIAGTAWAEDAKPWQPKGPTGVAVRTLAELAFTSREWK
ncbi:MAG TPA: leucyl aminopeptidase [Vicinamibacterales bacterium]|nr:leucyl aminopeptidase [Vicinamibacterales bacterium]